MPAMTDDATIVVSVVVPACGRMDLLDRCLDALVRQQVNPHSYEIIVVDDEPNHNTLHLVAGWRTRTLDRGPRLTYIANPGPNGPAAARNRGWRAAHASIVAFTSDDAVPEPGWLAAGLAAFDDSTEVVCGRVQTLVPPRPTDGQRGAHEHEAADFTSASCFFRKSVLERLGGFDERFNVPRGTDADMYFRLLEHGVDVLLLDEPTRGIDVGSKAQIYQLIDELAAQGKAVLMVSSYLPELLGVCDRIAVMAKGRLNPARLVAETDEHQIMTEATATKEAA